MIDYEWSLTAGGLPYTIARPITANLLETTPRLPPQNPTRSVYFGPESGGMTLAEIARL